MDETPRETAHEPAGAAPSTNGNGPPHPADIAREIKLADAALEELDMRVASVQAFNLMIFGAIVLVLALELKELRG